MTERMMTLGHLQLFVGRIQTLTAADWKGGFDIPGHMMFYLP